MTDARLSPADWPTLAARIAAWLPAARWFGGKGSAPSAVTIHDAVPLPGGSSQQLEHHAAMAGGGVGGNDQERGVGGVAAER